MWTYVKRTALPGRVIGRVPIPVFSRWVSGIGFDILDINLSGYADTVRSTGARTSMEEKMNLPKGYTRPDQDRSWTSTTFKIRPDELSAFREMCAERQLSMSMMVRYLFAEAARMHQEESRDE